MYTVRTLFMAVKLYGLQFFVAPEINVASKMHTIHNIIHFSHSFCCRGQRTASTVDGVLEEMASVIITYRTYCRQGDLTYMYMYMHMYIITKGFSHQFIVMKIGM